MKNPFRTPDGGVDIKQFYLAVFLIVFGCGLLVAGFCVSPTGEIHASVLTAFGEIITLAGAILGINYASGRKVERIKRELKNEES